MPSTDKTGQPAFPRLPLTGHAADMSKPTRLTRCGQFALLPKQPFKCDPRMGSRSEPEAAQTPFRDMPMRQGEIRGSWPADSDRLLLLHELPRSRTSVRAVGVCAAGARCGQWNRRYSISKGSSAM